MHRSVIAGKVYVVGDHVDTDQIIPAQYLNLVPTMAAEYRKLGTHAFSGLPEDHPPFVKSGSEKSEYSIVIAGRNFGCGSSREHAPVALGAAGVQAVVAESYARIFFRNVISTGEFFPCEFSEKTDYPPEHAGARDGRGSGYFRTGDMAEISIEHGSILNRRDGKSYCLKPIGAASEVIEAGGLFGYARKKGMIRDTLS